MASLRMLPLATVQAFLRLSDRLTDVLCRLAPPDLPPGAVRTAVNGTLVLLLILCARSILSVRGDCWGWGGALGS